MHIHARVYFVPETDPQTCTSTYVLVLYFKQENPAVFDGYRLSCTYVISASRCTGTTPDRQVVVHVILNEETRGKINHLMSSVQVLLQHIHTAAQRDVHCCPFSRHAVACRGSTCGKTFHGIFHRIPPNPPRTSTAYHVTLTLTLTPTYRCREDCGVPWWLT